VSPPFIAAIPEAGPSLLPLGHLIAQHIDEAFRAVLNQVDWFGTSSLQSV
jgi:hypothetical protein